MLVVEFSYIYFNANLKEKMMKHKNIPHFPPVSLSLLYIPGDST